MFRIGDDLVARLPRRSDSKDLIKNEQEYLPLVADLLSDVEVAVPTPVRCGEPALGYPWNWSIVPWFDGIPLAHAPPLDSAAVVELLGQFGSALHAEAPDAVRRNPFRGVPLAERDAGFVANLAKCPDLDRTHIGELWAELRDAPEWGGPPLWVHGDLHPHNLVVRDGRIPAVIDWGDISAGDPAVDLAVAWMALDATARDQFRDANRIAGRPVDIHTWKRARGSALAHAVSVLAHSSDTPTLRRLARRTIASVTE